MKSSLGAFVAFVTLGIIAARLFAQDAPPSQPIHWDCVATPPGPKLTLDWSKSPIESLNARITEVTQFSTDTTPPVITSVIYSGGPTVLDDKVKIPATSTSVQFAVTANDNIGVQSFALYVDDALVSTGNGGNHVLAQNGAAFAVRWNSGVIDAGAHRFKLTVFDAGGNASEIKTWSMVK